MTGPANSHSFLSPNKSNFFVPPFRQTVLVFSLILLAACPAFAEERIVAVGDIHGDYDAFVSLLQRAKLVNNNIHWIGGKSILIQTGDFLDRGLDARRVLDLFMRLEKEAKKKRGRVLILLGNHEVMNMMGDLRYVNRKVYEQFADDKSESRRQSAYRAYQKYFLRLTPGPAETAAAPFTPKTEEEWMEEHPPGFLERQQMFGPSGKYGKWLRKHDIVKQVGGGIFLHGGIHPDLESWGVKKINRIFHSELTAFDQFFAYFVQKKVILPFFTFPEITTAIQRERDRLQRASEIKGASAPTRNGNPFSGQRQLDHLHQINIFFQYRNWLSVNPNGPLWFRGFSYWEETEGNGKIHNLLKSYRAEYFVVGHTTVQGGKILPRFGGKVLLIDTGILTSVYQTGQPSALVIQGEQFTALYLDHQEVLLTQGEDDHAAGKDGDE